MAEEAVKISAVDQKLNNLNKSIKSLETYNIKKASSASVGKNNSQAIKNFKMEQKNMEDMVKLYLEHIKNVYEAINETKESIVEIDELKEMTPSELVNKTLIRNRFAAKPQGITSQELEDQIQALDAMETGEYEANPDIPAEAYIGYSLKRAEVESKKIKAQKMVEEHPEILHFFELGLQMGPMRKEKVEKIKEDQRRMLKASNWSHNTKIKAVEKKE